MQEGPVGAVSNGMLRAVERRVDGWMDGWMG